MKEYQSKRTEIQELRYKLIHLGEALANNDVIMDYRSGYPVPKSVVGTDPERYWCLHDRYSKKIEQLEGECAEIEEYIEGIPDSMTRRIFRMYFIDGIPQKRIAKTVHTSQSVISEKISKFLNSDKNDKKVCYN